MSEVKQASTRTRDVVIEICPQCNALHIHGLLAGRLDGLGKEEIECGVQVGWSAPEDEKETQLKPVLCNYKIKPREDNTFTVRHFTLRERQEYNTMMTAVMKVDKNTAATDPKLMDWVLLHGVTKAPFPLKTAKDIDEAPVNGMILESAYYAVLEFNAPPLAPSSGLRQLSTQTPQKSATTTP